MGRPTGGLDAQNKSNPSFLSASLELGLRLLCRNKPEADQNMAYFRNKDGSYTKNYFMEATPRPGSEAFWGELTDIFRRAYDLTQAINAQLIIVFPADKVSRPSEFHKCAGRFNSKPVARL
jgi:hypothetical protein